MAAPGSYENASHKPCWETCSACFRCKNKGRYTKCNQCSGRHDPSGHLGPDLDDYCDCVNGILRWRDRQGRLIISKYKSNPFKAEIIVQKETEDERDWNAYLKDCREKMDNPTWDLIVITEQPANNGFKYLGPAD